MNKPTNSKIRERHERTEKLALQSGLHSGLAAHKDRGILLDKLEAAEAKLTNEDRPQYCVCNKHRWLTAISKWATFQCPACRADTAEAKLDAIGGLSSKKAEDYLRYKKVVAVDEIQAILEYEPSNIPP